MTLIEMAPSDRYAIIGKTGSGKTRFAMVMASKLAPAKSGWRCWWVDSKGAPEDLAALRSHGFADMGPKGPGKGPDGQISHRQVLKIRSRDGPLNEQMDGICARALTEGGILLAVDEYRHVTTSTRTAGRGLLDVHQRGRGLQVGLLGLTQEPVEVPRQLLSQAAHIVLMELAFPRDIVYAQTLNPGYVRPRLLGDPHGLWHGWIDGDGEWRYYSNMRRWFTSLFPRERKSA